MSTEAALLVAICADSDDDTARFDYAHFLEEKDAESDTGRMRHIRTQVEFGHI